MADQVMAEVLTAVENVRQQRRPRRTLAGGVHETQVAEQGAPTRTVAILTDAVTQLVGGLEELPTGEPTEGRTARAAQDAHRILLSLAVAQV